MLSRNWQFFEHYADLMYCNRAILYRLSEHWCVNRCDLRVRELVMIFFRFETYYRCRFWLIPRKPQGRGSCGGDEDEIWRRGVASVGAGARKWRSSSGASSWFKYFTAVFWELIKKKDAIMPARFTWSDGATPADKRDEWLLWGERDRLQYLWGQQDYVVSCGRSFGSSKIRQE